MIHLHDQINGIRAVSFRCTQCKCTVKMGANAYMGDLAVAGAHVPLTMTRGEMPFERTSVHYEATCIPCLTRKSRKEAYVEHEKAQVQGGSFARFICAIDFNKQFRHFVDEEFIQGYRAFERLSLKTLDEQERQESAIKRLEAARMQNLIFGRSPEASQRYTGLVFLGDVRPDVAFHMPDGNYDGTEEHVKPDPMKWRAEWEQARLEKTIAGKISAVDTRYIDKVLGEETIPAFDLECTCARLRREMLLDSGVMTLDEFVTMELDIRYRAAKEDMHMKSGTECPPCKPLSADDIDSVVTNGDIPAAGNGGCGDGGGDNLKIIAMLVDRVIAASDGRAVNVNVNVQTVGGVSKLTFNANVEAVDGSVKVQGGFDPAEFGNIGGLVQAIEVPAGSDPDAIGKSVAAELARGTQGGGS